MIAHAKGIAADIDETVAAVESLRAGVFRENRKVENSRALARPGDAPFDQRGGEPGAFRILADVELMKFDRARRRLVFGQIEIDRPELDETGNGAVLAARQRDRPVGIGKLCADAVGRVPVREECGEVVGGIDVAEGVSERALGKGGKSVGIAGLSANDSNHEGPPGCAKPSGTGQVGAWIAIARKSSPIASGSTSRSR